MAVGLLGQYNLLQMSLLWVCVGGWVGGCASVCVCVCLRVCAHMVKWYLEA